MIPFAPKMMQPFGGGRAFNPLTLSPALWLSDTGSNPAQWDDLSGNARHATQANSGQQPAIIANALNGRQVRRFDGVNDSIFSSSFQTSDSCTIFAVAKLTNWATTNGGYCTLASHAYNSTNQLTTGVLISRTGSTAEDWVDGDLLAVGSGFTSTSTPRAIGSTAAGSNFRIIACVLGTSGTRLFTNSIQTSTRVEANGACAIKTDPFFVGNSGAGVNDPWDGDIAEIIYLPYAATTPQRQQVENYLRIKYALY